ncbi:aminotransferase class V-fold PLP-dependent enzyme [Allokutzneria sp. A3M-2-11 16]|uniref:aminotransferase class V-fold PLP-dependent enzyme n=1 Tax=Allokutzneria sp. A3M-2-11 16 TaxID=2962043 RepID=UPI0020B80271|nr:aminotransferase class V-fold PLP-dependent enzyme [Allokutzneria sp. A3M-2-11 16]MCP3797705.1 aminotransferase class V-fold PLP-dependent enzyme [Allokutzneria sp. A3M-2-11 16]
MFDDGIDLDAVRTDTPGARERIFLDSAGSSLPPEPVLLETISHLRRESEVGGYRAAAERADDLEKGYAVAANFFGCEPEEIAFTESATRSWLNAFTAVPLAAGDRVLISEAEYGSNAVAIYHRARLVGARVDVVPSDETGALDLDALRELLDERVKLVSLVHAPTNSGLVNPVREAVEAAHDAGALVLLDACQSAGQLRVKVDEIGADLVAVTGRKWLRGPRGTGVLVVRNGVRLCPTQIDQHGATWRLPDGVELRPDARVHELWEFSVADRLGLIAALRYADQVGIDVIERAVRARAEALREGLAGIPRVRVHDIGAVRSGIVSFSIDGIGAGAVKDALRGKRITVSAGGSHGALLDMSKRGLTEFVRASPHYFVSPAQVSAFLEAVADLD